MAHLRTTAFGALGLIALAGMACATTSKKTTDDKQAQRIPEPANDPEADDPEDWLDSLPSQTEPISIEEGRLFVESVFDLVDRKIFDPAYRKRERDEAHRQALAGLEGKEKTSREEVADAVDQALKGTTMSHLRLLPPESVKKLRNMVDPNPKHGAEEPAVTTEIVGRVGVLRIRSFLVPRIRFEEVQQAIERLRGLPTWLFDRRGNGGGSTSSVIYLAQYLLGSDRSVGFSRCRSGAQRHEPFIQRGFFPDEQNIASKADAQLEMTEGFVDWRTPEQAPPPFKGKAFLLTDGGCGSACDQFAAAIKEHGAARLLGWRTAGKLLSGIVFMPRWRGHLVLVPISSVVSPLGHEIEGVGVPPDFEIAACRAVRTVPLTMGQASSTASRDARALIRDSSDECRAAALRYIEKEHAAPSP